MEKLNRLEKKGCSKRRERPEQQSFSNNCSSFTWETKIMLVHRNTNICKIHPDRADWAEGGVVRRSDRVCLVYSFSFFEVSSNFPEFLLACVLHFLSKNIQNSPEPRRPGYASQLLFICSLFQMIKHKVKPVLLLFTGKVWASSFFFTG